MEEKEIENKTLDEETGKKILDIFKTLNQNGMTVLIVTHDLEIASACKRRVVIEGWYANLSLRKFCR